MNSRSTRFHWIGLIGWLLLAFAPAVVGAVASLDAPSFYAKLSKPAWAPLAGVFGPVWTVLYTLMGVASWLVWRKPPADRRALTLYVMQLASNALWSWLFFAWHRGAWAAFEILVLLALIIVTIAAFRRVNPLAAVLLLPYLLWVSFATALNWDIWQRNPALL
jgi:tryptophan-rich sensory protein